MPGKPKGLPKTGGRKPGSENKTTKEVKEVITELLKLTAPKYANLFIKLKDDDFMDRFEKLLDYGMPKLQRSDNTTEHSFRGGLKIGYGDKGKT